MALLRQLAASSRTLSILVAPDGARFSLKTPVDWRLEVLDGGQIVAAGRVDKAALFVDGLMPDTTYRLHSDIGSIDLRTRPCAGLVDASAFGLDTTQDNNAQALQRAVEATPEGGTLRIRSGRYATGPVFLKPRMTLLLEEGACLAAIGDRTGWPVLASHDAQGRPLGTWEGLPEACYAALLTAVDCHGLTITGRGRIDGGGDRGDWWTWPKERRNGARRPRTLHLAYSDGVSLSGVTICNSPSWTVHPYRCDDLRVSAVRIENPPDSPNTDGLNPESCQGVEIVAVDFSVGDDCIAIKAGKRAPEQTSHLAPTRGVTISHCRMERGHGAVVLGSEMSGGIADVLIRRCEFDQTDRGLRLKTRRGRGGSIEDIRLMDVDMTNVPTPLAINAFYFCDADGKDDWVQTREPAAVDETTPRIARITMEHVRAENVALAGAAILGLPEAPVEDVVLRDVEITFDPDAAADVPLMALGVTPVRHVDCIAEFAQVTGTIRVPARERDSEEEATQC